MSLSPSFYLYSVWQKGYFQPFPLTVGIRNLLISLLSCSFTLFYHINGLVTCVPCNRLSIAIRQDTVVLGVSRQLLTRRARVRDPPPTLSFERTTMTREKTRRRIWKRTWKARPQNERPLTRGTSALVKPRSQALKRERKKESIRRM